MKKDRLFIYCAGGLGQEVLHVSRQVNQKCERWGEICFVDDSVEKTTIFNASVYTFEEYLNIRDENDCFLIANGNAPTRKKIYDKLSQNCICLTSLVAPDVPLDDFSRLQDGTIIMNGLKLGSNHRFGICSYVNFGCTIGHNSTLGDFSSISLGAIVAGDVTIGNNTYIGAGAVLREGITIGDNCIIGMGSIVTKDIPDNVVAYGNPCRIVKENTDKLVFKKSKSE